MRFGASEDLFPGHPKPHRLPKSTTPEFPSESPANDLSLLKQLAIARSIPGRASSCSDATAKPFMTVKTVGINAPKPAAVGILLAAI